jgi:beta-glucanase (GH16 family)
MKTDFLYVAALFYFASFLLFSCGKNNAPASPGLENVFVINETDESNFYEFSINEKLDVSNTEWIFSGERIFDKKKTTCYFDKKGTYEIKLKYTHEGKKGEYTQTLNVPKNSTYFDNNEYLWWNDEFDGDELDKTCWSYDTGSNKNQNRWGNNELQNYTDKPENSFIRDGKLCIKALLEGEGQHVEDYTSARIVTKGKKEFSRGRVEVKAKLGGGTGLWPAIWLYQSSWLDGYYSELDIMEYVGHDKNIIYSAVHTNKTIENPKNTVGANITVQGVESEFHIYGANWTDGKVEFYVDNPDKPHLVFSVENTGDPNEWPFDKNLYLLLNIAVGGDWGGMKGVDDNIFPQEMEIEYVRVFKKK